MLNIRTAAGFRSRIVLHLADLSALQSRMLLRFQPRALPRSIETQPQRTLQRQVEGVDRLLGREYPMMLQRGRVERAVLHPMAEARDCLLHREYFLRVECLQRSDGVQLTRANGLLVEEYRGIANPTAPMPRPESPLPLVKEDRDAAKEKRIDDRLPTDRIAARLPPDKARAERGGEAQS
eukprot:266118-Prymnesium_polylepis.3